MTRNEAAKQGYGFVYRYTTYGDAAGHSARLRRHDVVIILDGRAVEVWAKERRPSLCSICRRNHGLEVRHECE